MSPTHQPSSRTLFTCWCCLMSSQSHPDGRFPSKIRLWVVFFLLVHDGFTYRLFSFFLKLLEALTWEEIIWLGEQVWTDKGLCGAVSTSLPLPGDCSQPTAQCGVALGLWTVFASIRDCSTWKHSSRCQVWLSLGCCNLHLMVLVGSAASFIWNSGSHFSFSE